MAESSWVALGEGKRSRRGRKPELPLPTLFKALLFHFLLPCGTVAEHLCQLFGVRRAESTLSERRQALAWPWFERLLRLALRPMADTQRDRAAFWRGWRLLAWDGTQFSLTNTPQNQKHVRKAASRRRASAWGKVTAVVLLELGLHNPVAVAIGCRGQSEYALTQHLLAALLPQALLLADRLTGCPAMLYGVYGQLLALGSHFLVRVRKNFVVLKRQRLADGSCLIKVAVRHRRYQHQTLATFTVREIVVQAYRHGFRTETIRLWTSLLDPATAPALELAELYTRRWEQELYFRQMKLELRKSEVLQSHTPETGAQEIALLVLATALLAQERARAAAGQLPALEVSFLKCLELLRPLWLLCALAGTVLTPKQWQAVEAVFYRHIQACRKPKRRHRSCTRAVRQPVKGWPRLLKPKYACGPWKYSIVTHQARKSR